MSDFEVHPIGTAEEIGLSRALFNEITNITHQYGAVVPHNIINAYNGLTDHYRKRVQHEEVNNVQSKEDYKNILLQTVSQQIVNADTARYYGDVPIVNNDNGTLFQKCFENNPLKDGLVVEFGVHTGGSTVTLKNIFQTTTHAFDSFLGLPDDDGHFKKGQFNLGGNIPELLLNTPGIEVWPGWFSDSIPLFAEKHKEHLRMVSVDCDTYIGAKDIFTLLKDRFVSGTTIYFDEMGYYYGWEIREYRAFLEFIQETGFDYKYIGKSDNDERCAVVLL